MKRFVSMLISITVVISNIILLAPLKVSALSSNLVSNPSVETISPTNNTLPDSWLTGSWGTNTATFAYETVGHTGSRSVKVNMTSYTSGDAKWYFSPQAVTSGSTYTYSDYYQSTTATSTVAQFDNGSGTYQYQNLNTNIATSSDWAQTTATFTVPSGFKNVTIFHLISAVGTLSIDDVSLAQLVVSAPTVNVTSPAANATVTGSVTLLANASDTNGIASVQFKVDGVNVGLAVTKMPYSTIWDSTAATNGSHTITATATNSTGVSTTSASISVTVNNAISNNLVPNSSVETANTTNSKSPLNWQSGKWGTNTTTFSYLTTGGHTGARAVQVSTTNYTSGDAKWFFNPISVTTDTQYSFSDYYKATIASEVDAVFDMSDGTTVYQIIGLPEASSTTWANFTTTFTIPQGAINMTVYHLIHGRGTLTVDDESLQKYTPVGFNRPLITLTFDDGYEDEYTQALPLLQKYGYNSTQFIVTGLINTSNYMTVSELQALAASGSEIASHTVTHTNMLTETAAKYISELSASQLQLQTWIGTPVTDVAFPYGLYNKAIINQTKIYYAASRGVEYGLNSKDKFNAYDIKVQNIYNTTTTAQVADWVAQAQTTKTWLVLVYHSIDAANSINSGAYNVTPAQLDSQLLTIKNSGVTVLTMQQALVEIKPQL
jgi:peptidoglycan/xylan/chitin deacetylase (PgdA/CDA1 family)